MTDEGDTGSEIARRTPGERSERAREAGLRADTHPALLSLASWLRRRLPGDERFGDALSTTGEEPAQVVGRGVASLQPDRPSVVHELGLVGLQLWQSMSDSGARGRGERDVAIVFTDLVGFSSWALEAGDEAALELLREVVSAVEDETEARGGRIIKWLGDGSMSVFGDPKDAVDAALAASVRLRDIEVSGHSPRMRAGVHVGRPRKVGGDYLGIDVNVAARVADAARAEQLLVSETTFALLDGDAFEVGRSKTLRAAGAPKGFRVRAIKGHAPSTAGASPA